MSVSHTPAPWLDWSTMEWLREPQKLLTNTEDACLIAAAPELLEACQRLDDFWLADWEPPHQDPEQQEPRILTKETLDVWRSIRSAIAKATGQ